MESTPYVFPFRMVLFYIVVMGWIFLQQLIYVRIQNIEERAITIGRRTVASMGVEDENEMDSGMLRRSRCVLIFL